MIGIALRKSCRNRDRDRGRGSPAGARSLSVCFTTSSLGLAFVVLSPWTTGKAFSGVISAHPETRPGSASLHPG